MPLDSDSAEAPPQAVAPPRPADDLRFGAAAPSAVEPGRRFVAEFVAYADGDEDRAMALLKGPNTTLGVGGDAVARGTRLEVSCSGRGVAVDDEEDGRQPMVWQGRPVKLVWAMRALAEPCPDAMLRLDVSIDGIVVARIRLSLAVATAAAPDAPPARAVAAIARRAFASYSSRDRLRVLDRVAAIRLAAGIDVFLDCHDLFPGREWQPELERQIRSRELFLLFWSEAARQSPWVRWEYETALAEPAARSLQVQPLDNGVELPAELRHLHGADPYMDLREANAARAARVA